ncbi:MAG: cation diffusion facilitator family transporter [Firmicutes bacterium]|nr:cation diffusion facilitator family transporter [Bacillota bacterium]
MSVTDQQFKEREEKLILKISFVGCILFLIAEFSMAVITDSKALLMDCIWDGSDLIMLIPMMILVSLLKKPVSEKRPFGFSQVESIIMVIKCSMLIVITCMLIVDGIESIIHGGNMVDGGMIAIYQLVISAICGVTYIVLKKRSSKLNAPTVKAEIFIWKLDSLSTLGVGIGFAFQYVLTKTSLSAAAPYVDPAIAIIMAVILLREPVKLVVENIRNLALFAPEKEIRDEVHEAINHVLERTQLECSFLDAVQTGRKLWLSVYFTKPDGIVHFDRLNEVREEIYKELARFEYEDVYLTLTPDLDVQKKAL